MYGIPENRTNTINPIYGSLESLNDAELVNPIYGDTDFEDVPYGLASAVSDYETPISIRRAQGKTIQDTQLQGIIKLFVYLDSNTLKYSCILTIMHVTLFTLYILLVIRVFMFQYSHE